MKRQSIVLSAVLATMLATALPAATSAGTDQPPAEQGAAAFGGALPVERGEFDSYIVVMRSDPLVVTEGQDNLHTTRATNRGQQKKAKHDDVLRESGVSSDKIVSDYVYALDGFAANVTYDEAVRIATHKDVALVLPDH